MIELDLKDRKILAELDQDSRQPLSKIAKELRLSTESINYRLKRLDKNNIITHYQTIVNLSKLSILQFKICLSLQHITSKKLEEIIKLLKQNKAIKWIVSCNGQWDMMMSYETDSINNINNLKDETLNLFKGYINKKAISILVEADIYNRDYLTENKKASKSKSVMKQTKQIRIDQTDMVILKELSENSRKSIVEIAKKLNSTPRITNYRIKQLIKNEIITGFKIGLNYEILGIRFYKILIYLDNPEKEKIISLINYFKQHKNIINYGRFLGNWDIETELEVYSEKEFNNILIDMKDKFNDIIKNIEVITISKEHKLIYF